MTKKLRALRTALAWAGVVLFLAISAEAAGTFTLRSTSVQEVSGGWHVFCRLALPRAPSIAHTPMKFLFTKTVVYERALVDTSTEPVQNRQPLVNQTPSVESLDVDFADPSGKIWPQTNFDFSLTRTRGYEAGEYQLKVRTSDGVDIGSPTTIILKGDNPVVDRRSITFNAKEKAIKKYDPGLDGGAKVASNEDTTAAAVPTNGDVTASGEAAPFIPPEAFQKTPEEEAVKPKGCGCAVPGLGATGTSAVGLPLVLAGLVAVRRRRRQSTARA
jgi:MYXO-CTERM domain-containing protein